MAATRTRPTDEWLTFTEFTEFTKLSARTARRYIAEGRIPAYRVGPHQIRVRRSDAEALFERIPTAGGAR